MDKKVLITVMLSMIGLIILGIIGTIGYYVVKDLEQEAILAKEMAIVTNTDLVTESIDMQIKTTGDYAVVEKTIKVYLNDYGALAREIIDIMNKEELAYILTPDNYKEDSPDFVKSKEFIVNTRNNFNESMDKLIEMTSEENIMKSIENKGVDEYYIELYRNYTLDDVVIKELQDTQRELINSREVINNLLDIQENIIDMLIENKGKWQIVDDIIEFSSDKLTEQYNELIDELYQEGEEEKTYKFSETNMNIVLPTNMEFLSISEIDSIYGTGASRNYKFVARDIYDYQILNGFVENKNGRTAEEYLNETKSKISESRDVVGEIYEENISGFNFKILKSQGTTNTILAEELCMIYDTDDKFICLDYVYKVGSDNKINEIIQKY